MLYVRPKPGQQKLLDQLRPQRGVRYKTRVIFQGWKNQSLLLTSQEWG